MSPRTAKGKMPQRDTPQNAAHLHAPPTVSSVSLPGGSGSASIANKLSSAPTLPALQRTTSRLRQEVSGGGLGHGGAPLTQVSTSKSSASLSAVAADGRRKPSASSSGSGGGMDGGGGTGAGGSTAGPFAFSRSLRPDKASSSRATDRTDALWAEMQATLEEVELSASEGTRVFGPDHDHKLAALRQAQIALAQAWARSEAEDGGGGGSGETENLLGQLTKTATGTTTVRSTVAAAAALRGDASATGEGGASVPSTTGASGGGGVVRPGSSNNNNNNQGASLEQETQVDILLARKRREANDRYFERVSQGVLDVVAKLEDVAQAMRAVEQENKDIWGDNEEADGPSIKVP